MIETETDRVETDRDKGLRTYIAERVAQDGVSKSTAERCFSVWDRLQSRMGGKMPVPDAASDGWGGIMLVWDKDQHHLELEFFADGTTESFYRNRITGAIYGDDIKGRITRNVLEFAAHFV